MAHKPTKRPRRKLPPFHPPSDLLRDDKMDDHDKKPWDDAEDPLTRHFSSAHKAEPERRGRRKHRPFGLRIMPRDNAADGTTTIDPSLGDDDSKVVGERTNDVPPWIAEPQKYQPGLDYDRDMVMAMRESELEYLQQLRADAVRHHYSTSQHGNHDTAQDTTAQLEPSADRPSLNASEIKAMEHLFSPVEQALEKLQSTSPDILPAYNTNVRTKSHAQILEARLLPIRKHIRARLAKWKKRAEHGKAELMMCRYIALRYWPLPLTSTTHLDIQRIYRNAHFRETTQEQLREQAAQHAEWREDNMSRQINRGSFGDEAARRFGSLHYDDAPSQPDDVPMVISSSKTTPETKQRRRQTQIEEDALTAEELHQRLNGVKRLRGFKTQTDEEEDEQPGGEDYKPLRLKSWRGPGGSKYIIADDEPYVNHSMFTRSRYSFPPRDDPDIEEAYPRTATLLDGIEAYARAAGTDNGPSSKRHKSDTVEDYTDLPDLESFPTRDTANRIHGAQHGSVAADAQSSRAGSAMLGSGVPWRRELESERVDYTRVMKVDEEDDDVVPWRRPRDEEERKGG